MNKLYEGMFLFDANLASKDWPGLEQHVNDLLGRHSAELVHAERWPDRKLAYEMKGCRKGSYYLTYFNAPPDSIDGLRRDVDLSDRIMRLLVTYDEALPEECAQRQEAEQASREKAAADKAAAETKAAEKAAAEATGTSEAATSEAATSETAAETVAETSVAVATEPSADEAPKTAEGEAAPAADEETTPS